MSCITETKSKSTLAVLDTQHLQTTTACKYCGEYAVTYSRLIGNASCSECGAWQLNEGDLS